MCLEVTHMYHEILGGNKPRSLIYLVSALALVQKLSRLKSLLLQFLDSKLKLVVSLGGLVALLGVHPRHQAMGTLPIPETLLILQRPVAWRAEMKRSVKKRIKINKKKNTGLSLLNPLSNI